MSHYEQPNSYNGAHAQQQPQQYPYQAGPAPNYQQQQQQPGSYGYPSPAQSPAPVPQYHDQKMDPHQQHQPQQPGMAYQQQPQMTHEKPVPAAHVQEAHKHGAPGKSWNFGFWDCFSPFSTCCFACWCPCLVYGKTYDREHGVADSSGVNMMCCAWYCAATLGANGFLQFITRGQMREKYGIEGDAFKDFCGACCCPCCALMQEEKESLLRTTGINPVTKVAYQPVQGMGYHA